MSKKETATNTLYDYLLPLIVVLSNQKTPYYNLETTNQYTLYLTSFMMKRGCFLTILFVLTYGKVPAADYKNSSSSVTDSISGSNLNVYEDAYVYGLTEESKAKVVYSYKKDKNRLKPISNKKLSLAGKKKSKNIRHKQIKGTIEEIKGSTAGENVYFSQLQSFGAFSFLPTKLSEIAGLIKIEEFRALFLYDNTGKIIQSAILFSHGLRTFRFCRPPPSYVENDNA
ncbi:hypothetical protein [Chryseobacterium sp. POE27]|uniref:hypothetical protein n=1 Tax=Chryseobacterium sp. POE27 TaxID=3138177 RepID=UPI00321AB848